MTTPHPSATTVVQFIVSSANNNPLEKAYAPQVTIFRFKIGTLTLELVTGTEAANQERSFEDDQGNALHVGTITDSTTIAELSLSSGTHVKVGGVGGAFGNVPKYEMADDEYENLSGRCTRKRLLRGLGQHNNLFASSRLNAGIQETQ